jgi:hypothetical protein
MTEKLVPKEPDLIDCEVCMKEIPETVAMTEEGQDYVLHFCGLECYTAWKQKKDKIPDKKQ